MIRAFKPELDFIFVHLFVVVILGEAEILQRIVRATIFDLQLNFVSMQTHSNFNHLGEKVKILA